MNEAYKCRRAARQVIKQQQHRERVQQNLSAAEPVPRAKRGTRGKLHLIDEYGKACRENYYMFGGYTH
jgi:hypothetical protein